MRNINLFLTLVALIGLARPAMAGEDRFYLDFDLPAANQSSASSLALSPAGSNPEGGLQGFGVSMGYALPRESGEWRIAAGLGQQSPFALQGSHASEMAALRGETGEADASASVSLLYAFDLGDDGLFGVDMRPYVGGGIGLTRRPGDSGSTGPVGLTSEEQDRERYNLSWGLTAGVNMPLTTNLNLSLAYRYVGQGEGDRASQDREARDPDSAFHSHDLMLIFGVSF